MDDSIFDRKAALQLVDGRLDLLVELSQTFLDHYRALLTPLDTALKQGDAVAVAHAAHDLKGALGFFGPTAAAAAATQLHQLAMVGDPRQMEHGYQTLLAHLRGLVSCLTELVDTDGKGASLGGSQG